MNTNENLNNPTTSGIANHSPQSPASPPTAETQPPSPPPHRSYSSSPSYSSHNPHSSPAHFPLPPSQNHAKTPDFPHFPLNFLRKSSRSNDRLANLPPEDQAQIVHWFSLGFTYTKIIELAAQPRPEGLNLRLSLGVLHRFYQKHDLAEKIANAAELVAELCPENAADPEAAFEILAQTHVLHTMAAPNLDNAAFQHLTRYLCRQQEHKLRKRAVDLRETRLAFEMQHKHFDLFKRTMEILPELNQILADKALTTRERVKKHLDKIFGRECREMVERANQKWAAKHPESKPIEPQVEEKDVTPAPSSEWNQAEITRAMKIALGPGFENLFEDSSPTNAPARPAPNESTPYALKANSA